MIGGGGEHKTLRLVANYADACNLFPGADIARKLDVLRGHCEAEGRDYDAIEKTTTAGYDAAAGPARSSSSFEVERGLGVTAAYLMVPGPDPQADIERLAAEVVPENSGVVIAAWMLPTVRATDEAFAAEGLDEARPGRR